MLSLPALHASCPRHRRFNGRDPNAVRGNCKHCNRLLEFFKQHTELRRQMVEFEEEKGKVSRG